MKRFHVHVSVPDVGASFAFNVLEHRIKVFASLPMTSLDKSRLKARVEEIGTSLPDG